MMEIDPRHMVDNREPQLRFQELVEGKHPARVFLVRDPRKRCGKTMLLKRLIWNCRFRIPSAPLPVWVDLEEVADPSPFHLLATLSAQLPPPSRDEPGLLPEFFRLRDAVGSNPLPFMTEAEVARLVPRQVEGIVHGGGQTVATGGTSAGVILNVHLPEWNEAMRPAAERMCIQAFERDLRNLPPDKPLALFIDSVDDKAQSRPLRQWVVDYLLEGIFMDPARRPEHAVLVLAGRTLGDYGADFGERLLEPPFQADWQPADTEEFLRLLLGGDSVTPEMTTFFHRFIVEHRRPVWNVGLSALGLHQG